LEIQYLLKEGGIILQSQLNVCSLTNTLYSQLKNEHIFFTEQVLPLLLELEFLLEQEVREEPLPWLLQLPQGQL